ncbi:hypothetical protein IV500_04385 [Paeniglutamicibacter antarcticus]|uniref:Uncharacterized protein n=1 Tax=Arthrobacter terrae TaxID=2935737 RepID=A0A931G4C4_9MICC|nr:hypothetical protein [Arthrobacter terrae]MBG0738658.1 hypothetical protein [Arthrobacter terrae]
MPTEARSRVIAVERTVNHPLQDTADAYADATGYIDQLPEQTENFRADQLRTSFRRNGSTLMGLRGPEREYVIDRSIQSVLEIGFILGDLQNDWRR